MAEREPAWFNQASFPAEVISYSLRRFGFLQPIDFIEGEDEFVEAVETVGKAVFTLQIIIRNRLRPMFISSINLAAGVANWRGYNEITQFMHQGYLRSDAVNSILSVFAIMGELIMFLGEFGYRIPEQMYYHAWSNIYEYKLRDRLFAMGGFSKLVEKARLRYIDSDLYRETSTYFENNIPNPYAEVNGELNWPDDPVGFLHQRLGVAPQLADVSMRILRKLYERQDIVPPPQLEHIWL